MAPQKSPAFQFYPKDFAVGTATMSLQEVGAYMRLLCYSWDAGSVPNDANERARILGCSKAQERELWSKVAKKFALQDDVYINPRMEEERKKQSEYRRRQSDRGKAGATARWVPDDGAGNGGSMPPVMPAPILTPQQNDGSSSSSSSLVKDQNTHTARVNGHGNGANAPNSLPRDHRFHAICGPRMRVCLTDATAAKLADKWGGLPDDAMGPLREFVEQLEAQIGDGAKGDFLWLMQHFEGFMALKGRTPVAPPVKVKPDDSKNINAEIDAWAKS